ncbi:uncharacterized protein LOC135090101 isoform X1 [Scylla paramamosain]|uniref:uncharacterized protein LOC135090101 isoform X1 n=1 Tax=Scylla paramamosain TaxID=85552 RepID=UPI003082C5DA
MEGCEGRPRSPRPRGARWRGDCMSKASTLQIFTSRACGEPVSRVCTISSATELRVACVSRRKQCVKFSHYETHRGRVSSGACPLFTEPWRGAATETSKRRYLSLSELEPGVTRDTAGV